MTNLLSLVFLHSIGLSQRVLARIFEDREDFDEFYQNLSQESLRKLGFKDDKIPSLLESKAKLDTAKITNLLDKLHVQIITIRDPLYPELLKQTPICPYFLYVRGILPRNKDLISIIGSRKSTSYSRTTLLNIIPDLIQSWYGVVSGGAYGVDSIAHKITLEQNGYTLAVFGTGIDRCYPRENKELFNSILDSWWALISPFPLEMSPEPYNFPIRNEIVAGLSRGTLVTEAAEKSGTLITTGLALDFGRDVFALPADITRETSKGTNALIRDGQAKLILSAMDILAEYGTVSTVMEISKIRTIPDFSDPLEKSIYELISSESLDISTIANSLGVESMAIACKLSIMEVHGTVEITIDGSYKAK